MSEPGSQHRSASRSPERLRAHYEVERELADRLRHAPAQARKKLYPVVYTELFARVPDHPQITRTPSWQHEITDLQMRLLRRFLRPGTRFLEIGTGDGELARAVAPLVTRVYALDVTEAMFHAQARPPNLRFVLSDGTSVPLPPGQCDVAYSHQLLEHLHPQDAMEQSRAVLRALSPAGWYVFLTPSALSGPHDVSRHFSDTPRGFHLVEYTVGSAAALMRAAGFDEVRCFASLGGRFYRVPMFVMRCVEGLLGALPAPLRRAIARRSIVSGFLGVTLAARKPA